MPDQNEVPLLLQYLFGEAAETAQRVDSPRLMRWAEAFDAWLAARTSGANHYGVSWAWAGMGIGWNIYLNRAVHKGTPHAI